MTGQEIADVTLREHCPGCGAPPGRDCACEQPGVHFARAHAAWKDGVIGRAAFASCMGGVVTRLTVVGPERSTP